MFLLQFFRKIYSSPKRTLFYGTVLFIMLLGIFIRTYHFSDWLHFETDQVDDYYAVAPAIEKGFEYMPLVGPKAGGTDIRLGPVFYFFEFISASLIGNTPAGHASATLFFALFSLPLFFITARLYFNKLIALFLTGIFSTSIFFAMYARFSWNPNLLPFFTLLILLSLTKAVSEKNTNKQMWWFSLFTLTLAITMQLHISALIVMPLCTGVFLIWKRPHFNCKVWIVATLSFLFAFSPIIIYETKTHGENFRALANETKSHPSSTLADKQTKLIQTIRTHAGEYMLILTGYDSINGYRPTGSSFGISCASCSKEAPYRTIGYLFLIISIIFLIQGIVQSTDKRKRDFLIFLFLWLSISFLFFFFILLSGKYLYPRFFLLISPLPLFFFGLILDAINPKKDVFRFYIAIVLTLFIIVINMRAVFMMFESNGTAFSSRTTLVDTEDVFPDTNRIILKQQQKIVDVIATKANSSHRQVYLKSESEYEPSLWLLLNKQQVNFQSVITNADPIYSQGLYVFVFRTASPLAKDMQLYKQRFTLDEEISFGTLTLQFLNPKQEFLTTSSSQMNQQIQPSFKTANTIYRFKDIR